jgi:hypothetical protein
MEEGSRRTVGYALFGVAALMLLGAALVATGSFRVAPDARTLIATVLGGVAILDAALGAYFVVTSGPHG